MNISESPEEFSHYLNEMQDRAFAKALGEAIIKKQNAFRGTYIINPENGKRLINLLKYLKSIAEENEWAIHYLNHEPQSIHADVSLVADIIDLYGAGCKRFFEEMQQNVDVFGITPRTDGKLLVDFSVNNVWEAIPHE